MVFWRNRSAKKAETPVVIAEEATSDTAAASSAESQTSETQTNVVTLVTTRLADRLAGVATAAEQPDSQETKALTPPAVPTGSRQAAAAM